MDIVDYLQQLAQDVMAKAETQGLLQEEAFFDVATDLLIDCGELSEAHYAQHRQTGVQVDGYGGLPKDEDNTLKLVLIDYDPHLDHVSTLTTTDAQGVVKRGQGFLRRALDPGYTSSLEESTEVYRLARLMESQWDDIIKIRFVLITNKVLSARFDPNAIPVGTVRGDTPVLLSIWDLRRMSEVVSQTLEREPLSVDFRGMGYDVSVLPANTADSDFPSYLAVLPGRALADIYDRYGTRLLEQNVRVYLQARGKVNRGILTTILDRPEMFFAFNNGLTATVEALETEPTPDGLRITALRNLQIVNGGQTAASIHLMSEHSRKRWRRGWEPDLSRVFVQVKISIVPPDKASDIVPKISQFANSQNAVSDADFFANHPYHVEMERFAERLYAPPRSGALTSTKWFYERMRGQYQNARNRLSGADLREFEAKVPRSQVITKTDLAKFLMPWDGKPEVAQRGAAKCFMEFAAYIRDRWDRDKSFCNEAYFRTCVAKAIIFRRTERIVSDQPWYEGGGNRAPIVVHTLGKLAADLTRMGRAFPFDRVWREQRVPDVMDTVLASLTTVVKDCILDPPTEGQLPTEWAKQPACTARVAALPFVYTDGFLEEMLTLEEHRADIRVAKNDQRLTESVSAEIFVVSQGPAFWEGVRDWGASRGYINEKDKGILASAINGLPSERQADYIWRLWNRLQREGCPLIPVETRKEGDDCDDHEEPTL